ncbi:hypothetical protein V1290_000006 [Bradyrhizobium sp. AZCC 1578]|uniref:hypothetical protein n=1 Tax=Bradyrhizobium sp. AZCC 1578 TaxID=3117027 RepID=UPI002FF230B9
MTKVQSWEVSVSVNGESILTIGHNHLAGASEIDAGVIENCAHHLLAFIGRPLGLAEPQKSADALRLLADLFSESAHETWTREEIVNIIEDAIRLGSAHSRPLCGGKDD